MLQTVCEEPEILTIDEWYSSDGPSFNKFFPPGRSVNSIPQAKSACQRNSYSEVLSFKRQRNG
jgi:hypothetical protein